MIAVDFYPHGADARETMECETIGEAVDLVRELARPNNRGRFGRVTYEAGNIIWSATLCCDRLKANARPYWSLSFPADGIWRGRAGVIGEMAGIRYASHRAGYRATERAMGRFVERVAYWTEHDKEAA